MKLPYLTADLPGIGGRIKERIEDFQVEEIPLYEPCGTGTHVYFRVLKKGVPTAAAAERIARYMSVRASEIGIAGLKDAQGITTQMMSLEHADSEKLAGYKDTQVRVVWISRHGNKLRLGHLRGNRFVIRIRGVGEEQVGPASEILDVLIRRGVPNYFGAQRFGLRGDTGRLGEALVKNDLEEFVAMFLGRPQPTDPEHPRAARDAFDAGCYQRALQLWPRHYANERRALAAYKKKRRPRAAVAAISKRMKRFYISAFQSCIFNEVLAKRIDTIDKVLLGDLGRKTDTGGIFTVEDVQSEQPRADAFEISPTGPLVGYRASLATGEPGRIEHDALDAHGIAQGDFRKMGRLKVKGARRALRARLEPPALESGTDEHGNYIQLGITAPPGCYATMVLREIMKTDVLEGQSASAPGPAADSPNSPVP